MYEKPRFRGRKCVLAEGDVEIDNPWTAYGESGESGQPRGSRPFRIGSFKRVVRVSAGTPPGASRRPPSRGAAPPERRCSPRITGPPRSACSRRRTARAPGSGSPARPRTPAHGDRRWLPPPSSSTRACERDPAAGGLPGGLQHGLEQGVMPSLSSTGGWFTPSLSSTMIPMFWSRAGIPI